MNINTMPYLADYSIGEAIEQGERWERQAKNAEEQQVCRSYNGSILPNVDHSISTTLSSLGWVCWGDDGKPAWNGPSWS